MFKQAAQLVGIVVFTVFAVAVLVRLADLQNGNAQPEKVSAEYKPESPSAALKEVAALEKVAEKSADQLAKMRVIYLWLTKRSQGAEFYRRRAEEVQIEFNVQYRKEAAAAKIAAQLAGLTPEQRAMRNVAIEIIGSKRVAFDTAIHADLSIANSNQFPIKDIKIQCTHVANSGPAIDSSKETIYEAINARSARVFPDVSLGFVHSKASLKECQIIGLVLY